MAETIKTHIHWKPSLREAVKRLAVEEKDRLSFVCAYEQAIQTFSPCIHALIVETQAVGDGFALLSGIWVADERLLHRLAIARHIWAFAVTGTTARQVMPWLFSLGELAAHDCVDEWLSSLSTPEGEQTQAAFMEPSKEWIDLLPEADISTDTLCGLAFTQPARTCAGCARGCTHCSACSATNTNI